MNRTRIRQAGAALAIVGVALVVLVWRGTSTHDGTGTGRSASGLAATTTAAQSSPTGAPSHSPAPVGPPPTTGGDDSAGDPTPTPAATSTVFAAARERAEQFAAAWLNTTGKTPAQWRASLTPRISSELAAELADADPATVPVGLVGTPVTAAANGELVTVTIPITTGGTLTVTLSGLLVVDIDWTAP